MRHTGIAIIGDVPWGTHLCQFYQDKQDLIDILVPYFKAGLENNEFCVWVTSEPLFAEEAKAALAADVEGLERYIRDGQMEILDHREWRTSGGKFESDRMSQGWVDRLESAQKRGFDGLRLAGNTFWLEKPDWQPFIEYEAAVHRVVGQRRMLAMCSYSLARCGAIEVMEAVSNHSFALIQRAGQWQVVESAERKRMEASLREREDARVHLAAIVESSNDAIIGNDLEGTIQTWNAGAERMFGYSSREVLGRHITLIYPPELADQFGSLKQRVRGGDPIQDFETIRVRKDGSRIEVALSLSPIRDRAGTVIGISSIARDITARAKAEEERRHLASFPEMNPNPVIETDAPGNITYANPATPGILRSLGMEPDPRLFLPSDISSIAGAPEGTFQREIAVGDRVFVEDIYAWKDGGIIRIYARDVTEGKRAEETLRQQREWLRVTLTSIGDAVLATDTAGRITFLNPVAAELTGWTEEQALGQPVQNVFRIVNEQTRDQAEDVVGRVLREGHVTSLANHTVLVTRDGREIPIEDSAAPIQDRAGHMTGAVLVFHDVTAKRRAQEALRDSEAQFRTLSNAIPQLCWMANADGWLFWYNQRWYEYTGATPEQMEGWGWQSVHDPEELPKVLERWKGSIATGEPFDMVLPLRGADGVFRPFLTRVMPVRDRDGNVARWFGTNTDISGQRKTEEALAASEGRLRALLESASQAVVAVDQGGHIILVNAQTEAMFGYTRDELLGQPLEVMLPERYREAHADERRHYFERPHTRVIGLGRDLFGRTKAGSEFPLEVSLSCVEQGGSKLALALITDITERKRAEARLWQAQKMESIGLLAGGVAHDFNNLLIGVIGNASLALEMMPPGSETVDLLQGVIRTGEQLAHLTRQMLAYSGRGQFVIEPLDLSGLIPEMSGLVQPSIPKKIALHLDLAPNLPPVEADRGQVQQVFMNLVLNAAEAIGSDSGVIAVKTGLQAVDEGYIRRHPETAELHPGEYVRLEVSDTGCGMDEATKAKIFDPFFSTKFTGRGLGLAAVAGIVRGHKGAIQVSSACGQGSCFTVLFPSAPGAAAASPGADREVLQSQGTVLVVDDEKVVRDLAKRTLERYGYVVLVAHDGPSAIDICKRHSGDIALAILDLSMPEMGGVEALPELRKIRPGVKVVVSSGYSEDETMTLFQGQPVSGFVQKPYSATRLAETVGHAIR
jgi:two-component system, cell cycle sensor histidine kinase and response regulator CckA